MKKIIALSLAVLMLAALFVGCGGEKKDDANSNDASSVKLSAVLDDINSKYNISDSTVQGLKRIETTDELDRYYMIAADDIKQFAAERSSSADDFTEIVLVEATGSDAANKIVTQLNSRLDAQRSTARSYTAEAVEMLEKCEVKTKGNFVYMVINEKSDEINKTIEEAIA